MTIRPATPAAAARRQLLIDRFTEYLTEHGAQTDHAAGYARDLRDIAEDLGMTFPPALDPPPPPAHSTREGRDKAKQLLAEALAARHHPDPAATP